MPRSVVETPLSPSEPSTEPLWPRLAGAWGRGCQRWLALAPGLQLLGWAGAILVLKLPGLLEPPVWDSAMGVFPPAIYLYETGFDIRALLQEGNWWQGGPNVHSLSLYTWLVAGVMTLTGSATATFALLHLATFGVFAGALVLYTRMLRGWGLGDATVVAAGLFLLLMPLVLVQVGYLYTETFVMALGVAACAQWQAGRPGLATALCALALFVKLTAVAVSACLAGVLLLTARPLGARRWAMLATLPLALFVCRSLGDWLGAAPVPGPSWGEPEVLLRSLFARLTTIPDVTLTWIGGMLAAAIVAARRASRIGLAGLLRDPHPNTGSQLVCLAMPFVFAAGVLALVHRQSLFLPRYLVPVVPFALASLLLLARELGRERIAVGGLLAASVFFALNYGGALYPPDHQSFSIVERSHAYRDFRRVQAEAIEALAAKPAELPAWVSKEVDYMVSHPMMGYVEAPIANVHPIYLPPHAGRTLDSFPPEFLLLHSNVGHGGAEIARLVQAAGQAPGTEIRVRTFERAGFRAALYWIQREAAAPSTANAGPPAPRTAPARVPAPD